MNDFFLRMACLVIVCALALPVAAGTPARSSLSESRGYQTCRAAAERAADVLHVARDYYIYEEDGSRLYYMNGYARLDGSSMPVKIACLTNVSGHRIDAFDLAEGRYAGRLREHPAVAAVE